MAKRVLVIGATGLLGNAVFRLLLERNFDAFGTTRRNDAKHLFCPEVADRLITSGSLEDLNALAAVLDRCAPDAIVNCAAVGRPSPADPMRSIAVYATLPQRLAYLCRQRGSRLIQISSDGVFSGRGRGNYSETDVPDAQDVYGVAKLLGEVAGSSSVTLRLSMIGHELAAGNGLLEWFLSQRETCRSYRRAIFSGPTTVEIAKVIRDVILPRDDLQGVYHIAARQISKYDLLRYIAASYGKDITLIPDDSVEINRSLSSERFHAATGYIAPSWPEMIDEMKNDRFGLPRG